MKHIKTDVTELVETMINDERKSRSFWQDVFFRYKRNKLAIFGLALLVFIIAVCLYGVVAIDYDMIATQDILNRLQPPSFEYPFGTDPYGRSVLIRIIYGSRFSLFIGFTATTISLSLGGVSGAVSGYFGGKFDMIFMRFIDMFQAIPPMLLSIAVVAVLGPSLRNLIIAMSIADIPFYARVIRSSVLSIRDVQYIEAAVAIGANNRRIIARHVFPNTLAVLIVQASLSVGFVILAAAGLGYLGLGIMPPTPEWGNMLYEGQQHIRNAPWLVIFPGIAIMLTVLSLNLLGDGLRDSIDPKLKN